MEQRQDEDEGFCYTCSVPSYLDTEYDFVQVYMSLEEEQRFRGGKKKSMKFYRYTNCPLYHHKTANITLLVLV